MKVFEKAGFSCVRIEGDHLDKRIDCLEHKLDGVAAERRNNTIAIRGLTVKLDSVAADLYAHRQDTEAHPTIYKVKEDI